MRTLTMLSRTADNLYWMGRYLERAEHTARLIDVHLDLILDQPDDAVEQRRQYVLAALSLPVDDDKAPDDFGLTYLTVFDPDSSDSVKSCIGAARHNARQVREQISTEMWNEINQFYLYVEQVNIDAMWSSEPREFFEHINEGAHLFHGITDGTMNHGQGWHFVVAGRFIERVLSIVNNVAVYFCPEGRLSPTTLDNPHLDDDLRWMGLLRSCTGFEAYCKFYTASLNPSNVLEFLLFSPYFPHSVAFSVRMLHRALIGIADAANQPRSERALRRAGRLYAELYYGQLDEVIEGDLDAYLTNIAEQCQLIHEALYATYITYDLPVDAAPV